MIARSRRVVLRSAAGDARSFGWRGASDLRRRTPTCRLNGAGLRAYTVRGSFPVTRSIARRHLCPGSEVAPNMQGQPPGITLIPRSWQNSTASAELLPGPTPRWIQTRWTPGAAQSLRPLGSSAYSPTRTG